jgi:hypothetical protein
LVAILWDLDNVSPGVDPERARITARRLRDAASRLGGGALGGGGAANGEDEAGPAEVVAFLGFANDATLEKVSAEALRDEGVDVRRAKSTPDAADMDLGAHVCGFARAWETQTKAQNSKSVANVPPPPPFVTPRALAAAEHDAVLRNASSFSATADSSAASAAHRADARAALALAAAEAERAAFDHFGSIFTTHVAVSSRIPKAALLVVTSDNDVVPAVAFARRSGCFVVACGDFVPKAFSEGGGAQASKRARAKRRRFASGVEVGVTPAYWATLQNAANKRPVGRLKLAAASDAALVWDSTRVFDVYVDGAERDERTGKKNGAARDMVVGGVVGVWRSRGAQRGVGRWPSPRPAIPSSEDESV